MLPVGTHYMPALLGTGEAPLVSHLDHERSRWSRDSFGYPTHTSVVLALDNMSRMEHDARTEVRVSVVIAVVVGAAILGIAIWAFKGGGPSVGPFGGFGGGDGDDGLGRRSGPP
jgi:hypothetical protein